MTKEMFYPEAVNLPIFETIQKASTHKTYVIGGFVRDFLLNKHKAKDIDIVVLGSGIELAKNIVKHLPHKHSINIYKNYGTAMIKQDDTILEFVGARKESYQRNSRNPIVENGTMDDDQKRRDFTINAIYMSQDGEIFDPFSGAEHLKKQSEKYTPL